MRFKSLEAFCAAVEEKTISGAARRLYLSQPSVSERLAVLEREAGVELLKRSRRGVELTQHGVVVYEQARKLLEEARTLEDTLDALSKENDTKIRFAACMTVGERILPQLLWRFKKRMPEAVPLIFMGNDPEVLSAVNGGEMSIGVVASGECQESLECASFLEDELVIAVAPSHSWAGSSISPEDLSEEPFISREEGSAIKAVAEQKLEELGHINLDIHMELASTTAIKEVVEEGWAFSIFSRADIQRKLQSGALLEVPGFSIPWSFTLIRRRSAVLSRAEESFYRFLLEVRNPDVEGPQSSTNYAGQALSPRKR